MGKIVDLGKLILNVTQITIPNDLGKLILAANRYPYPYGYHHDHDKLILVIDDLE